MPGATRRLHLSCCCHGRRPVLPAAATSSSAPPPGTCGSCPRWTGAHGSRTCSKQQARDRVDCGAPGGGGSGRACPSPPAASAHCMGHPQPRDERAGRPPSAREGLGGTAPWAARLQTLPRSGLISVPVPCAAFQSGAGGSPGHIDAGSRASRQHIGSLGDLHGLPVHDALNEVICGRRLGRGRQAPQLPPLQASQLPQALQRRHGVHGCGRRCVGRGGGPQAPPERLPPARLAPRWRRPDAGARASSAGLSCAQVELASKITCSSSWQVSRTGMDHPQVAGAGVTLSRSHRSSWHARFTLCCRDAVFVHAWHPTACE